MTLAEKLEDATSNQPYSDRPAEHYVTAGQRARAQRRATWVGGTAAVALLLLGAGAVTAGLQSRQSDPNPTGVASQEPALTSAAPSPNAQVYSDMETTGAHAGYNTRTGELVLDDGWRITQRIDSPWQTGPFGEPTPPTASVALVVTDGTEVQWLLLDWEADAHEAGSIYDDNPGARGFTSLAAYIDVEMARRQGRSTDELVAFGSANTLEPRNGVTMVDQRPVVLSDGTQAVLAQLRVLDNDWYIVARRTPSKATYVPVAYPREDDESGLDGFLIRVNDLVARGGLT